MTDFIIRLTAVACGSAAGGTVRWLVARMVPATGSVPWATFAVNCAGCLLIGLIAGLASRGLAMPVWLRLALTVGFCGGLTTFSTFVNENFMMLGASRLLLSAAYTALSLAAGLILLWAGWRLAANP